MEKILEKKTTYNCTNIQQTTGSIICTNYTETVEYTQNTDFIDAEIKRLNYIDYFVTMGIVLLFILLLIKRFLFK